MLVHQVVACTSLVFLEEYFLVVDLKVLFDDVVGGVSGEEGPEDHAAVDGGDADGVVADEGHRPFFYFFDIGLGDLDEGLPKEYVAGVELGVEAHPMRRDVQSSRQDDSV